MAVKQLQGRFNIKNVKMVEHRHFRFHTNMLAFKSTEISRARCIEQDPSSLNLKTNTAIFSIYRHAVYYAM